MSHGTPPVIPDNLRQYNSYVEDPKWQGRFTLMWCSLLAFYVVLAAPRVVRGVRSGAAFAGIAGVRAAALYAPLPSDDDALSPQSTIVCHTKNGVAWPRKHWVHTAASLLSSFALWSIPGIDLNLGQMLVVSAYSVFTLVSIILKAPLMSNPNRAGFLALAQLPPVFLFAMKNSPLALLLGPGVDYTKLNFVHRWAGRGLFLGAVIHGAIWIENHLTWNLPILSRQKEASGVAAMACLCIIVVSSVAPLRRRCYTLFLVVHYLTFPAFFVTICYHTPFASPWIFPPLAFYAFDVLLRLLKFRIVVARVHARDGGMSVISLPAASAGWRAGQHVQVRALVGGRTFAHAHPLTILCAPPDTTCLSPAPGLLLAARACGPWSRALHTFGRGEPPAPLFAHSLPSPDTEQFVVGGVEDGEGEDDDEFGEALEKGECGGEGDGRVMHAILDGPYGGPTLDAGTYGDVLFLAGGSGVTATLGQLDELVGRCARRGRARGECTQRVEWVWCVRDADALSWFAPHLAQIAAMAARPGNGLALRIRVFVTGAAGDKGASSSSSCEVCVGRPTARALLDELVFTEGAILSGKDTEYGADQAAGAGGGAGFAMFAAGPRGLVREAGNAVARVNLLRRAGVDFCAEAFVL
ncbi:ferric reductase like transmembrane component-domain-containing protein [Mycena sp. CBHHK59/15]|nr:ferric reductase like transmembrane component-domain-containing protein [Mycena sp. CBHHK59/15]